MSWFRRSFRRTPDGYTIPIRPGDGPSDLLGAQLAVAKDMARQEAKRKHGEVSSWPRFTPVRWTAADGEDWEGLVVRSLYAADTDSVPVRPIRRLGADGGWEQRTMWLKFSYVQEYFQDLAGKPPLKQGARATVRALDDVYVACSACGQRFNRQHGHCPFCGRPIPRSPLTRTRSES